MKVLLLFVLSLLAYGVENLGTYGKTYEIIEPDMYKEIMQRAKEINASKIKKSFYSSLDRYLVPIYDVPICLKNRQRRYTPFLTIPVDIYDKDGKLLYKAGSTINPLEKGVSFYSYILFIDANDPIQRALAKMLRAKATIVVVKGDMKKLLSKGIYVYRADKNLIEGFDVECLPSVYTQKEDKFYINEYNPKTLIGNTK